MKKNPLGCGNVLLMRVIGYLQVLLLRLAFRAKVHLGCLIERRPSDWRKQFQIEFNFNFI